MPDSSDDEEAMEVIEEMERPAETDPVDDPLRDFRGLNLFSKL